MYDPLVRITGLHKHYRMGDAVVRAVTNVSLCIMPGEFVALVGRSGSGKSTLMSMLGLLERPDKGEYQLKGRDVTRLDENEQATFRNREIGFVFQLSFLLARNSARENVELPLVYAGLRSAERHEKARAALRRVGLLHRQDHRPHQLSGGEQQRVAIARALVNDPDLILADEPTGALDSKTADVVLSLFEDLNRDGRTIVMVTHAPDIAERAGRRIVIHDGQILQDDARAGRGSLENIES